MKQETQLSHDEMIKNLIRDYPEDALEFFKPEIFSSYGRPAKISFTIQEVKKHSHFDPNLKNDIAVIYEFKNGKSVILTLIEHWSAKDKFDIHRIAHYLIDLDYRYPDYEKLPVVLFTDDADEWKTDIQKEIDIHCLDKTYLSFRYELIRLKSFQADQYIETKNRFIAVLRSAMKYDRRQKVFLMIEFLRAYGKLEKDIKKVIKNLVIIEFFLKLNNMDREKIHELLHGGGDDDMTIVDLLMKEGEVKGEIKGKLEGKLEDARKMIQKGFSIEDILDITELNLDELIKAGIIDK